MTAPRQKLPVGIQSFASLRNDNCYYADKTGFALQLVQGSGRYFLSRPRRFGKSLFLDTLAEIFSGNRTLFAGLQIENRHNWQQTWPVLCFSFAAANFLDRAQLCQYLHHQLAAFEKQFGLPAGNTEPNLRLVDLLTGIYQAGQRQIVVLVDEYDKPILDALVAHEGDEHYAEARAIREELKNFYSVFKAQDHLLRFVFLTGVSKFSKVSLFSGLNNLTDLTLDARFSAICGITESELEQVFAAELFELDRNDIKRWYNGYNWLGEAVYNPYDLLRLFDSRRFQAYWFESGTPAFLLKLLMRKKVFTPDLTRLVSSDLLLSDFDLSDLAPETLLFQSGYLTIKSVDTRYRSTRYILGYPNWEVESAFNQQLLLALTHRPRSERPEHDLLGLFDAARAEPLQAWFTRFFASIPYAWTGGNPITEYEGYWASVFYSLLAAIGVDLVAEDMTSHGRIDLTLKLADAIWIFEFKVIDGDQPEGKALAQIIDRGYADKYRGQGGAVHLVGIEFSARLRNLVGWQMQTVLAGPDVVSSEPGLPVFFSYAHNDLDFVRMITSQLQAAGVDAFVADSCLPAGQNVVLAIEQAMRSARVMALLISQHTAQSGGVVRELAFARQLHHANAEPDLQLVPILLDDIQPEIISLLLGQAALPVAVSRDQVGAQRAGTAILAALGKVPD